jgi:hypothetical protein
VKFTINREWVTKRYAAQFNQPGYAAFRERNTHHRHLGTTTTTDAITQARNLRLKKSPEISLSPSWKCPLEIRAGSAKAYTAPTTLAQTVK